MRKSKTTGEVALMDVSSQQSSLGVHTRAKTLALQRLQKSSSSSSAVSTGGSGSYIQLRSRRLEKPPVLVTTSESKRQRCVSNPNSSSRAALGAANSSSDGSSESKLGEKRAEVEEIKKNEESVDLGIEASFGENVLEFDGRERSTRESTPCSLIRDPDTIRTPGSSTRPTTSADDANRRVRNSMQRHIPTANEMDEFFAVTEEKQQKQFMDKYNFDPVNDKPLPGRFEWIKVDTKKC